MSGAARKAIADALRLGVTKEQREACEPPYMAPSDDPNDYSAVCNLSPMCYPPSDGFYHLSGAPSAGTLQHSCCYVLHAG